ncbi:MAG: deoxyribose-phosphate aldolase [Methanobrevibacter sp.]|jgi:deoxyribose-phosphate aldolase|nr:deoxyribose-phosphate aldolase [Candidatus Methanovirga aequatorialis]
MINFKSPEKLAKVIEATNLKNDAKKEDIDKLVSDAIEYGFHSVVVSPYYVSHVKKQLKSSDVKVGTVVGFPLGYNEVSIKEFEAENSIANGADEIDMVVNILAIKVEDFNTVKEEIQRVVEVSEDVLVKVIIETGLLTKQEIEKVSLIAQECGVDFIKTSTGFNNVPGAKATDINLIKKVVPTMKIKASGGINNYKTAFRLLSSGADRIGTSSATAIVDEFNKSRKNYEEHLDKEGII